MTVIEERNPMPPVSGADAIEELSRSGALDGLFARIDAVRRIRPPNQPQ